jgi:ketosteroid isomerase-like protein
MVLFDLTPAPPKTALAKEGTKMTAVAPSAADPDIRGALQGVLDRMAQVYSAQDAAGCAALFTEDGALFSPYAPPAQGRDQIEALHRDWTRTPSAKRFTILECGGGDQLAWALAQYSEGAITAEGTTLAVFARPPGGAWLIRICSLNSAFAQTIGANGERSAP